MSTMLRNATAVKSAPSLADLAELHINGEPLTLPEGFEPPPAEASAWVLGFDLGYNLTPADPDRDSPENVKAAFRDGYRAGRAAFEADSDAAFDRWVLAMEAAFGDQADPSATWNDAEIREATGRNS
jgi:hypothetical protein